MKQRKIPKVYDYDLETIIWKTEQIQTLACILNTTIESGQLDTKYITEAINVVAGLAINTIHNINEIEVGVDGE